MKNATLGTKRYDLFRPFRAMFRDVLPTQGGVNARIARIDLPWAILFPPLRGIFSTGQVIPKLNDAVPRRLATRLFQPTLSSTHR